MVNSCCQLNNDLSFLNMNNIYAIKTWLIWSSLTLALLSVAGCSSSPKSSSSASTAMAAVEHARAQIGVKYRYGGASPRSGFDCSGLVYYSYKQAGKRLPRSTNGLYEASTKVTKNSLRPGDLVFFHINRNKISHVGIYLGQNKFVHAPSKGKQVEIASLRSRYWTKHFTRGGRI